VLWGSNSPENDIGETAVHFDCAHDLLSISVDPGEVVVDHMLRRFKAGSRRYPHPMSTPAVSGDSKGNSVVSVNRNRHSSHRYTPGFATKTHDLAKNFVHHTEPEKAAGEVVADCCCFREVPGEKAACRSRLFDQSIAVEALMEGISCLF